MQPSDPKNHTNSTMSEKPEDWKDLMPTERKSMWKTAEERRMSDLTRVLEWLERRKGKKKQPVQKHAQVVVPPKAKGKERKKAKPIQKQMKDNRQVSSNKAPGSSSRRDGDAVTYRRLYGVEPKGKRLSMVPGNYSKDGIGKPDLEPKDSNAQDPAQRSGPFHRQSIVDTMFQESIFSGRKSTLFRDWIGKAPDSSYERRLKSLMEKGTEPKVEALKILKPEEVLSCRYLRLSQNNIKTLLKLCKDAGLMVDIHPHMVEAEIDAKKTQAGPQDPSDMVPILEQLPVKFQAQALLAPARVPSKCP